MKEYVFDAKTTTKELVNWIKRWFDLNGADCNAVIGISGGKDSSVVAALCTQALGKDRVVGVMMPNGTQKDISDSKELIELLGIKATTINIGNAVKGINDELTNSEYTITELTSVNMPARMRVVALYAVSQSCNGRVLGTANLSESYLGWNSRWDLSNCNDLNPIAGLTVAEVKAVGRELELPEKFVEKVPSDGLCGSTDEDKLGFKYAVVDKYIRTGICEDEEVKKKIDMKHRNNLFKAYFGPVFDPDYPLMA